MKIIGENNSEITILRFYEFSTKSLAQKVENVVF